MRPPNVPLRIIDQKRRVCNLYKRSLRVLAAHYFDRTIIRYESVLMRDRFDKNKNITDEKRINELLQEGEKELYLKTHPQPLTFPGSYYSLLHNRESVPPDWVLDFWNPLEKAQYPEYFARREQGKKEYVEKWNKTYNNSNNKKGYCDDE